jgi:hypothetical protein
MALDMARAALDGGLDVVSSEKNESLFGGVQNLCFLLTHSGFSTHSWKLP